MYTIELDCPPGGLRPGDLLPDVLKDTGVVLGKPVAMFFGNWEWVIPEDQEPAFEAHRSVIAERIKALYNSGAIRYGSW
jgi:hypothetical protein